MQNDSQICSKECTNALQSSNEEQWDIEQACQQTDEGHFHYDFGQEVGREFVILGRFLLGNNMTVKWDCIGGKQTDITKEQQSTYIHKRCEVRNSDA